MHCVLLLEHSCWTPLHGAIDVAVLEAVASNIGAFLLGPSKMAAISWLTVQFTGKEKGLCQQGLSVHSKLLCNSQITPFLDRSK